MVAPHPGPMARRRASMKSCWLFRLGRRWNCGAGGQYQQGESLNSVPEPGAEMRAGRMQKWRPRPSAAVVPKRRQGGSAHQAMRFAASEKLLLEPAKAAAQSYKPRPGSGGTELTVTRGSATVQYVHLAQSGRRYRNQQLVKRWAGKDTTPAASTKLSIKACPSCDPAASQTVA